MPIRILVLIDDANAAEALCTLLAMDGYEAIRVGSVEEAQEALAGAPFAALIVDLDSPGCMAALGTLHAARAAAAVIFVTSSPHSRLCRNAANGARRVLHKPVPYDALAQTLLACGG